jgi:hypothetical protein
VVDLVSRGEVAGVIGLSAVLEFGEQGGSCGGLGCSGGGDGSDLAVVVAELCVARYLAGLPFLFVFVVLVEISPQVPMGSGGLGMCLLQPV